MEKETLKHLTNFFSFYKLLSYKKREPILRADDQPQGIYFLTKGYVRVYSISREGEELTLLLLKAHDFFPVRWAITNEPVRYYYEALTPVEAYRAPKVAFLHFLRDNPDVLFQFSERIFTRLGGLMKRLEYVIFGNADTKVASSIQMCMERFGVESKEGVLIDLPLTHKDIASLVGMTRETVSIALEKLRQKEIITQKNKHIVVLNKEALLEVSLLQHLDKG